VLEIRRYKPTDYEPVWQLHRLALENVDAHAGNGPWDDDLHDIQSVYLNANGEFLVAVENGEIVGMAALRRVDENRAEIKRMRVHPSHQRKGIGRAILVQLENRAEALGYTVLLLDTTTQQQAAQKFYENNGYVETERRNECGFQLICYQKIIP